MNPAKVEIYRGPLAPEVIDLGFDPEQRFLMALLRDGTDVFLFRFDNAASTTPTLVVDSLSVPEAGAMQTIQRWNHEVLGRVRLLSDGPAYSTRIALVDSDNDGSFDGAPIIGDRTIFVTSGIDRCDLWDDLLGP